METIIHPLPDYLVRLSDPVVLFLIKFSDFYC